MRQRAVRMKPLFSHRLVLVCWDNETEHMLQKPRLVREKENKRLQSTTATQSRIQRDTTPPYLHSELQQCSSASLEPHVLALQWPRRRRGRSPARSTRGPATGRHNEGRRCSCRATAPRATPLSLTPVSVIPRRRRMCELRKPTSSSSLPPPRRWRSCSRGISTAARRRISRPSSQESRAPPAGRSPRRRCCQAARPCARS